MWAAQPLAGRDSAHRASALDLSYNVEAAEDWGPIRTHPVLHPLPPSLGRMCLRVRRGLLGPGAVTPLLTVCAGL